MKAPRPTTGHPILSAAVLTVLTAPSIAQVRSEMPGPISGLGGVRAVFPTIKPLGPDNSATVSLPPASPSQSFTRPPGGGPRSTGRGFSGSGFSGARVSGSGLTVNGAVVNDNFRLALHLSSPLGTQDLHGRDHIWGGGNGWRDHLGHDHHHGDHIFTYPPFYYNPWWYDYGSSYGNHYDNIYGYYGPADPNLYNAAQPAAPMPVTITPEPSNARELGATYLRAGDPKAAASALRTWLVDHPRDVDALRLLAVALIDGGAFGDGAATMALAYHTEPLLGLRRLTPDVTGPTNDLREDVRRTSFYANRVKSSSAWLSLAVLMQAEGRDSTARSALQKARAAGLEPAVADRLEAALQ
jgi:hypothetical protein